MTQLKLLCQQLFSTTALKRSISVRTFAEGNTCAPISLIYPFSCENVLHPAHLALQLPLPPTTHATPTHFQTHTQSSRSKTEIMCYIDMTNYQQCADPHRRNHAHQVDHQQFAPYLRTYQYTSQEAGFFPCKYVLTGRIHPDHCRTQIRLSKPQICTSCDGTLREYKHLITYQCGSIVAVGYINPQYPEDGNAFHIPFVDYCQLCRRDAAPYPQVSGDYRGPPGYGQQYPAYDARHHAPQGPPNGYPGGWNYGW